jgi:hypothetical protein
MSSITGYLTPEARATLDAVFAKLAAPGMCNPEDDVPCVAGSPSEQAVGSDTRTCAQRNHDALNAAARALLASGDLGKHNGLPACIIVTTTLRELEAAAGKGLTGGGTLLPMSDVIRLARHAHHYLCIFDDGKAIGLYHSKRLASPGQRIILYARDRGCSHPGCSVPGYYCEVHHCTPYAKCHTTDVNDLTFGCGGHPPARRTRLDHPQAPKRRHRMDSTAASGPRASPDQYVSSPRKVAARRRRGRRGALKALRQDSVARTQTVT